MKPGTKLVTCLALSAGLLAVPSDASAELLLKSVHSTIGHPYYSTHAGYFSLSEGRVNVTPPLGSTTWWSTPLEVEASDTSVRTVWAWYGNYFMGSIAQPSCIVESRLVAFNSSGYVYASTGYSAHYEAQGAAINIPVNGSALVRTRIVDGYYVGDCWFTGARYATTDEFSL